MALRLVLAAVVLVPLAGLPAALVLGGPRAPAPMASIGAPFRTLDLSGVPESSRFTARDGQALAYRASPARGASPRGAVVLVHGSSARSQSVHPLAVALAGAGFTTYALDVRGHGESGPRGQVSYVGQLEDDLEDFLGSVAPPRPCTLVGFSSGGGFALRFAGGTRQRLFDGYVLLSPFLHPDAANSRPDAGGWVGVGVPRIVALRLLNRLGVSRWNDLPVIAFALDERAAQLLTPSYSFALAASFQPHGDYRGDLRRARQPLVVLVGQDDEVFRPEGLAAELSQAGRTPPVVVPGVGHVGLTLEPAGVSAVVRAVQDLAAPAGHRPGP